MRKYFVAFLLFSLGLAFTPEPLHPQRAEGCLGPITVRERWLAHRGRDFHTRRGARIVSRRAAHEPTCAIAVSPAPFAFSLSIDDVLIEAGFELKQSVATLAERKEIATRAREALGEGWSISWCERCERIWPLCHEHSTEFWRMPLAEQKKQYEKGKMAGIASGMFPLCEDCWRDLTPRQRLPFYRKLHDQWRAQCPGEQAASHERWERIEAAVLKNQ